MIECKSCGMICKHPTEYHPMAACLMFKACHDGEVVRANLSAVAEEAVRLERERVAIEQRAHDRAADLFHRVLCMGDGCQECVRVSAAIRARSEAPT